MTSMSQQAYKILIFFFLNTILFEEMVDFGTGAGNAEDKPGESCSARSKDLPKHKQKNPNPSLKVRPGNTGAS